VIGGLRRFLARLCTEQSRGCISFTPLCTVEAFAASPLRERTAMRAVGVR
jgi:hypothetical protein